MKECPYTKKIDEIFYRINYTCDNMKPLFLDNIMDCIQALVSERAELRELVESKFDYDTWFKIAEKYGWE